MNMIADKLEAVKKLLLEGKIQCVHLTGCKCVACSYDYVEALIGKRSSRLSQWVADEDLFTK